MLKKLSSGGRFGLAGLALGVALLTVRTATAAQGTTSARNPDLWTKRNYNVIVATIRDIHRATDGEGLGVFRATLVPVATIAGRLDPSLHPTVAVRFRAEMTGSSSILTVPKDGATVLVAVELGVTDRTGPTPANWIDDNFCPFLPSDQGMTTVDGPADPRVAATLKRLREARDPDFIPDIFKEATSRPSPSTKPAK